MRKNSKVFGMIPLATPINVPFWILLGFLGMLLTALGIMLYFVFALVKMRRKDILIFLDKNLRWDIIYTNISGLETYSHNGKSYHLHESAGLLNKRGKSMYVFTINVPTPLHIKKNTTEWLSGESLDGVIKNKIVQQIVKPTDKFLDLLVILGSAGGILAAISSIIILLITLGVIKLTP